MPGARAHLRGLEHSPAGPGKPAARGLDRLLLWPPWLLLRRWLVPEPAATKPPTCPVWRSSRSLDRACGGAPVLRLACAAGHFVAPPFLRRSFAGLCGTGGRWCVSPFASARNAYSSSVSALRRCHQRTSWKLPPLQLKSNRSQLIRTGDCCSIDTCELLTSELPRSLEVQF